ncbi:GNAT family N-acetyltransferase [Chondrinema litorale]|uniref:GNAT family N-acetyltransferase n=1 Tax=Chondrinema litorale TaxID=2994555 RepID=UPI002543E443|nr:GNAT family N-acetyltransferase [Chondrinema litorale]UZR97680.1 GNAT family N-acetyltransferase [Chondrinema litorale]
MKINILDHNNIDQIIKIANWYYEEWQTPVNKTVNRLMQQADSDTLVQLTITIDDELVGTGGIRNKVNILNRYESLTKYKPWISLFYIAKEYRNQGLGTILLDKLEQYAKEIKLTDLYLYTFTAESMYKRCGWKVIQRVIYKNHDTAIMQKLL